MHSNPSSFNKPLFLFWVPGGMSLMLDVEGSIAKALMFRGVDVHAVLCNGSYKGCILRQVSCNTPVNLWGQKGSSETGLSCIECKNTSSSKLSEMGITHSFIGDYLNDGELIYLREQSTSATWENLENICLGEINVGRNARSSIIRYLKGVPLLGNEDVISEFTFSALVCAASASKAIAHHSPQRIFMSHGVYADWGPALQTAFAYGIPVSGWMSSYLSGRFYFRNVEDNVRIDFHNISAKAWRQIRENSFPHKHDNLLKQYLQKRYVKNISFDMKELHKLSGDTNSFQIKYNLDCNKPIWGIMSHINWDAVIDASPMAYPDLDSWMLETIGELITLTDVQWLVKIHPAESWVNTKNGVQQLIENNFPKLPSHIRVLSADADINPLDFLNLIDGAVTGYGTAGLELTLQGKPVILAGEAHYGGKGFTYDGLTPESYRQLLRKASSLQPLNADQLLLAKKYAYCYFIQRQIPFPVVYKPDAEYWEFQHDKAHLLYPGNDPFTDFICDRILDGQDFIMPENLVLLAEKVYEEESVVAEDARKEVSPNNQSKSSGLKANSEAVQSNNTFSHESNTNMKPILGFDPAGEVFTDNGRVYRGVFNGGGNQARYVFDVCRDRHLFDAGVVNTAIVDHSPYNRMGYDLVLEHERVPFISYAHEWTPAMLMDAALFQVDLDLQLLDAGLTLKDCGVSTNVLFDGTRPVHVDFLSIIPADRLVAEDWLTPDAVSLQRYAASNTASLYFHEVFKRMFFPGMLFPLYLIRQNKFDAARKRLLETALNTTNDTISEQETFAVADRLLSFAYQKHRLLQEQALQQGDLRQFLLIQRHEIEELDVRLAQSDYSDYYELKGEDFDFAPSEAWLPKQWGVYNSLTSLNPSTVLDIGANTGWFSILAARQGARVVSIDNDMACMDILYRRAKQEGLPILPLMVDFLDPTPDVPALAELCQEPHLLNSRFNNDTPLLLSADKRIACDMVIALAIIHHLCLGGGRHLDDVTRQLALFAKKHLVLEFVTKEDPLIVGEPDFFKAQYANPAAFDWYTLESCIGLLRRFFGSIQQTPLSATRILLVCTDKLAEGLNPQIDINTRDQVSRTTVTNDEEFRELKLVVESPPINYVVGVTNICNLQCPLCITGLRQQKKKPQFMNFELFRQIIEKIRPYAQQVQLYKWGESLLHPDIIDMLALCDKYDLNTEISSNLSLENSDKVLEALVRFRLHHLIVSFDGVTQEDYARYRVGGKLDVVLANLRKLKELKERYHSEYPVISLQFLRNKFTENQVEIIEKNYRQWGADKYYVCDMTTVFKDRDMIAARQWFSDQEIAQRKYLDIDVSMHGKPCYFLYTTMIVEQDGSIPSCCFATDPSDDFGKWDNSRSILEMFNSDRFVQARRMFREQRHCSASTCDDCCVFTTWLDSRDGMPDARQPKVTVIIPSYNRARMLGLTIESFIRQDYPADCFDIIIADNNSTDNTREIVAYWQSKSAVPITYLFEQRQGVHYARNSAAKIAAGEILYFTDDDMIADSRLLSEIVQVFRIDPLVGAATGRVLPQWESPPPDWILKLCYNGLLSIFDELGEGIKIEEYDLGVYSCHQAIRRDAFFKSGGFNPESTFSDYIGDGETGLNIKLKALGHKFGYNSGSLIYHMIPPTRMTQDYLNKRLANQGSADCYTEYKQNIFSRDELIQRVTTYHQKILEHAYYATMKKISDDIDWHMDEARTHYYLSRISYDLRLAHDPQWRELVLKYDWINE